MPALEDMQLLREYATRGSEEAFTTLLSRHLGMVHSVAMRHVANPHHAEEITQAVFIILARKAATLRPGTILAGWLFNTTRLTAANFIRDQSRRHRHEQEAAMQSQIQESGTDVWRRMAPLLDEAIAGLNEADRNAIVLRFVQGHDFKAVGAAIGASEDGVRMRVNRALEKLRKFFARRGVVLSAALIAAALSANGMQAAPAGLLASVSAAAVAKAPATASTAALIKLTLQAMAWAKIETALIVGVGAVVVAGTATMAVIKIRPPPADPGQTSVMPAAPVIATADQPAPAQPAPGPAPAPPQAPAKNVVPAAPAQPVQASAASGVIWSLDPQVLAQQPPVVLIRSSELANPGGRGTGMLSASFGTVALGTTMKDIVAYAYNAPPTMRNRILMPAGAPEGFFDFMDTLPQGGREALQQLLKDQYGLAARRETRPVDALLLTIASANAPGLKLNTSGDMGGGGSVGNGRLSGKNTTLAGIAAALEATLGIPVIDQTGATDRFDYELTFPRGAAVEEIEQAAFDQLGIELVPDPQKQPMEFLVVEKVEKQQ